MKKLAWLLLFVGISGCAANGGATSVSARQADVADKIAIGEVISSWALYRDQQRWTELAGVFQPGATISLSWFAGPHDVFIGASQKLSADSKAQLKHQLGVPLIKVNGTRATSETSVTILVRSQSPFGDLDTSSYARFFDFLEKQEGQWKIAKRTAIYEKDRVDPVSKGTLPDKFFEGLEEFPAQLKFLAKSLKQLGRQISPATVFDGSPEMEATYEAGRTWLAQ